LGQNVTDRVGTHVKGTGIKGFSSLPKIDSTHDISKNGNPQAISHDHLGRNQYSLGDANYHTSYQNIPTKTL